MGLPLHLSLTYGFKISVVCLVLGVRILVRRHLWWKWIKPVVFCEGLNPGLPVEPLQFFSLYLRVFMSYVESALCEVIQCNIPFVASQPLHHAWLEGSVLV